ncbi:LexA repressor [Bordetella hinzii]|uniref:LexA family transcriptional regulator n=1 Tax=Bordetella hinzii TaxID=103855 RepID=UPI0004598F92|nr:XRE family transcriptional regulator [Bordetella hinzii]AKQ56720.1 LexA repressor [Bordetella hinzii]KCB30891.1 peptidase S24-like protein [Bordetella hinzii L60]SNV70373.1 LexA repressor [Bordetella hinzii]
MPAQPLTPEQLADAGRLRTAYMLWKIQRQDTGEPTSQEAIASALGFSSQSAVSQYLNGKIPLNVNALAKFATLFDCAPDTISPTLAQDMARLATLARTAAAEAAAPQAVDAESDGRFVMVRKVIFKISAGVNGFAVEYPDNGEGMPLFLPREWLAKRRLQPDKLYATRVGGASMSPSIPEASVVVVNTADKTPEPDAIFAVNHDGEFTVKRLKYDMRRWWLTSDNPDQRRFSPVECTDATILMGRVVLIQAEPA